jgi:hypothetical protein
MRVSQKNGRRKVENELTKPAEFTANQLEAMFPELVRIHAGMHLCGPEEYAEVHRDYGEKARKLLAGELEKGIEEVPPIEILIVIEGGLIQDVQGIPPGILIRVHDYDPCDTDDEHPNIVTNANGKKVFENIYSVEGQLK